MVSACVASDLHISIKIARSIGIFPFHIGV